MVCVTYLISIRSRCFYVGMLDSISCYCDDQPSICLPCAAHMTVSSTVEQCMIMYFTSIFNHSPDSILVVLIQLVLSL